VAWTNTTTFVAGNTLTAAQLNQQLRDNMDAVTGFNSRTFSSTYFGGNGAMTWTLTSGDVNSEVAIIAKQLMVFVFDYVTGTVGGTPNSALQVQIPSGRTCFANTLGTTLYSDAGGALTPGYCSADATGTVVNLFKSNGSNWTTGTNNNSVRGFIVIPISATS
jgi:hypothetical protein